MMVRPELLLGAMLVFAWLAAVGTPGVLPPGAWPQPNAVYVVPLPGPRRYPPEYRPPAAPHGAVAVLLKS